MPLRISRGELTILTFVLFPVCLLSLLSFITISFLPLSSQGRWYLYISCSYSNSLRSFLNIKIREMYLLYVPWKGGAVVLESPLCDCQIRQIKPTCRRKVYFLTVSFLPRILILGQVYIHSIAKVDIAFFNHCFCLVYRWQYSLPINSVVGFTNYALVHNICMEICIRLLVTVFYIPIFC